MNTLKKMVFVALVLAAAGISNTAGAAKGKEAVMTPAPDIKWEPLAPGMPLQMAKLWGDRSKGGDYAMFLKMPAGVESGMHAHTLDYYAVNVQGTWVHTVEGDANPAKELPVGSYVFQPGKQMHNDVCKGKTDCILFVHQHGKGDFIPGKAAATAKAPDAKPADAKPVADAKPAAKPAAAPAPAPAKP
jgi:hypothetical protein